MLCLFCEYYRKMKTDYLIIGQGLAGSLLSWTLIQKGHSVVVVDNNHYQSSSTVAAGLINPITGKRFVLSEQFNEFFEFACKTYQELELAFQTQFFYPKPLKRLLKNEKEIQLCNKRLKDSAYTKFMTADASTEVVHIDQAGYCDTSALLNHMAIFLKERDALISEKFDYNDLSIHPPVATWKSIEATTVIFAEGWQAQFNPWFDWIPFNPVKGEILTLHCKSGINDTHILNCGKWIVPRGQNTFKAGATYTWEPIDCEPTENGKEEILHDLKKHIPPDTVIKDHRAGVRPVIQDTIPVIGLHPELPHFGIFNGFASKGSLLIPYYANHFVNRLTQNTPLESRIDVSRFWN